MVTVYPALDEAQGFIVNTWTFTGAGTSGVDGFPYLDVPWPGPEPPIAGDSYNWQTAEVEYTTGTPGQNQPYPQSLFLIT